MPPIYFATNRNLIQNQDGTQSFGKELNPDGASLLRFGVATPTGPTDDPDFRLEVSKEVLVPDASKLHLDHAKSNLGSLHVFNEMRSDMKKDQAGHDHLHSRLQRVVSRSSAFCIENATQL